MTPDLVPLLTEKDLSACLGICVATLQRMRSNGTGPRFVRLGERRLAYRLADVEQWVAACTAERTTPVRNPRGGQL
jgi:predicted DNA-binding transcriptional regulator AlpA